MDVSPNSGTYLAIRFFSPQKHLVLTNGENAES